jgi:hypothetical protein
MGGGKRKVELIHTFLQDDCLGIKGVLARRDQLLEIHKSLINLFPPSLFRQNMGLVTILAASTQMNELWNGIGLGFLLGGSGSSLATCSGRGIILFSGLSSYPLLHHHQDPGLLVNLLIQQIAVIIVIIRPRDRRFLCFGKILNSLILIASK